MTAAQMMTASPTWCVPHDSIETAAQRLAERDCGALPVVDDPQCRRPVGVITDRDIVIRLIARGKNPLACEVREAMTPNPLMLHVDASFHEVIAAMMRHHVRRLLVVDDRGQLVGIITDGDLARATRRDVEREREVAALVKEVSMPADHASQSPGSMVVVGDSIYFSRPDHPCPE